MANQITSATNISGPDLGANIQNDARKYFNNFYARDFSVGASNDALVAYFQKYTGNADSGKNLAAAVLYTAQAQNIDPMAILGDFQKLPKGQLNSYLAAFLNFNRVPTSTLGIKSSPVTNSSITRNILP